MIETKRVFWDREAIEGLFGLTFELSERQRQDARARTGKMYRVPQAGPWWPAVGAPLERGVRPRLAVAHNCSDTAFLAWDV